MMAFKTSSQTSCPIAEVDRALAAYIHPRGETLRIRRILSNYSLSSLTSADPAIRCQHLHRECPHNVSADGADPPSLKDYRLQYVQAIRAKNAAQTRHRDLERSLKEFQRSHAEAEQAQPELEHDGEVIKGSISLMRQRHCLAELQAIQGALDKLANTRSSNTQLDPRDLVNSKLSAQPLLPAERLEQLSETQLDQTLIFKLKREILGAHQSMRRAQTTREQAQRDCASLLSLPEQVFALQHARDATVEWIQGELAKIEEDSVFLEDASPVKRSATVPSPLHVESAEKQIREAYDHYTSSRASLLNSYSRLHHAPSMQVDDDGSTALTASESSNNTVKSSLLVTKLLPQLPHLSQISKSERSLVQQAVYLQTQIASADRAMEETLLRLSGESHLLPARSKVVAAWGEMASEAEVTTAQVIDQQLQDSQQEMQSVSLAVKRCLLQNQVLAFT